MVGINEILIFLVGGIIGFVIFRLTLGRTQQATQQKELDNSRAELQRYKAQVDNHFNDSAKLMGEVASSYQALYKHMAAQSQNLLDDDTNAQPFPQLKTPSKQKPQDLQAEKQATQAVTEHTTPEVAQSDDPTEAGEGIAKKQTTQETSEETTNKEATQETSEQIIKKEASLENAATASQNHSTQETSEETTKKQATQESTETASQNDATQQVPEETTQPKSSEESGNTMSKSSTSDTSSIDK